MEQVAEGNFTQQLEWLTQKRSVVDKVASDMHMLYMIWHNQMQDRIDALDRVELIEKALLPAMEGSHLYRNYDEERKKLLMTACSEPEHDHIPYTDDMMKRRKLFLARLKQYMQKNRLVEAVS